MLVATLLNALHIRNGVRMLPRLAAAGDAVVHADRDLHAPAAERGTAAADPNRSRTRCIRSRQRDPALRWRCAPGPDAFGLPLITEVLWVRVPPGTCHVPVAQLAEPLSRGTNMTRRAYQRVRGPDETGNPRRLAVALTAPAAAREAVTTLWGPHEDLLAGAAPGFPNARVRDR